MATTKNSKAPARVKRGRGRPAKTDVNEPHMRDQIQQAAVELFYARGYNGTSTRDIANACGITSGAVYNHFASKDQLLLSIIQQSYEILEREMMRAILGAGDDPTDQLRSLVSAFTGFCTRNRHSALVTSQDYKFLGATEYRTVRAARIRLREMFEEVIQRGFDRQQFSLPKVAGKPSARLAAVAVGDMCLRVAEWFREDGVLTEAEACARYADLAVAMVTPHIDSTVDN